MRLQAISEVTSNEHFLPLSAKYSILRRNVIRIAVKLVRSEIGIDPLAAGLFRTTGVSMANTFTVQPNAQTDIYSVVFLLQPHFSMLAFTAAADALTTANLVIGRSRFHFITAAVEAETDANVNTGIVVSDLGIEITANCVLSSKGAFDQHCILTKQLRKKYAAQQVDQSSTLKSGVQNSAPIADVDALIVCGGYRCDLNESFELSDLLKLFTHTGIALGGLWNGVVALAHAGLMSGYACALHPDNQDDMSRRFPDIDIRADTVVIDRNRLSAAGPNSAFDLMLLLVQRHDSVETTQAIRNILRADVGNSGPIHNALQRDEENNFPGKLQNALQLMRSNLDEPLDRVALARHINMSTRAMERLFQKHLNTSPARQYMELRLLRAQELLAQSESAIGEIGDACGFISSAHFSRAFSKRFGCAPKAFRNPKNLLLDV